MQLRIGRHSLGSAKREFPPVRMVSVVIPVKNNPAGLRRVLETVRVAERYSPVPVEVIVVDDGSSDATGATAKALGAVVAREPGNGRYVGPGLLLGIGKTRNAGIRVARGDVIASLDADCRVEPHYFARIVDALKDHDLVALNQLPLRPDLGKLTYKIIADVVFKIGSKGAAEPSVAFRRSICTDDVCFTPDGYAEILDVVKRAKYGTQDSGNSVHTDMTAWRQRIGWACLALIGIAGYKYL